MKIEKIQKLALRVILNDYESSYNEQIQIQNSNSKLFYLYNT